MEPAAFAVVGELLERLDAERRFDLEVAEFAVRTFSVGEELSAVREEPRRDSEMFQRRIAEVA